MRFWVLRLLVVPWFFPTFWLARAKLLWHVSHHFGTSFVVGSRQLCSPRIIYPFARLCFPQAWKYWPDRNWRVPRHCTTHYELLPSNGCSWIRCSTCSPASSRIVSTSFATCWLTSLAGPFWSVLAVESSASSPAAHVSLVVLEVICSRCLRPYASERRGPNASHLSMKPPPCLLLTFYCHRTTYVVLPIVRSIPVPIVRTPDLQAAVSIDWNLLKTPFAELEKNVKELVLRSDLRRRSGRSKGQRSIRTTTVVGKLVLVFCIVCSRRYESSR